jgi:hypothetical protein
MLGKDLSPSLEVSEMDLNFEFYEGRQVLEMCTLHLVVTVMCTDGFEPPVTEG